MIWYIIFATVFYFQNGYVICTENAMSMELNAPDSNYLDPYSYMVAINRYNYTNKRYTFLCVGVLVADYFVLTVATCLNGLNDDSEMVGYIGDMLRGSEITSTVLALTFDPQTKGQNKNIALLMVDFYQRGHPRRHNFIQLPNEAFHIPFHATITVLGFTLTDKTDGKFPTSTRTINFDIWYGGHIELLPSHSFAAFKSNNSRNNLQMEDLGCPAFHNGKFIGLVSWVNMFEDTPAYFTDIFSIMDFVIPNMN